MYLHNTKVDSTLLVNIQRALFLSLTCLLYSHFLFGQILDPNFGNEGIVSANLATDGGQDRSSGRTSILDPSGKIITFGYNGATHDSLYPSIVRFNSDGSYDTTFGENGVVKTGDLDNEISSHFLDGALQEDGKIIAVGYGTYYSTDLIPKRGYITRFNSDGSFDSSFGEGGLVILDLIYEAHCHKVLTLPDGKLLVSGYVKNAAGDADIFLARLLPDGSLDDSFGDQGIITTDLGHNESPQELHIHPNQDRILVTAGQEVYDTSDGSFFVLKYHLDGTLDTDFNDSGYLKFELYPSPHHPLSLNFQGDNKMIISGANNHNSENGFAIRRIHNNGTLDTSFGNGGIMYINHTGEFDFLFSVQLQSNGKILAIGARAPEQSKFKIMGVMLDENGGIDTEFGDNGILTKSFVYDSYNMYLLGLLKVGEEGLIITGREVMRANITGLEDDGTNVLLIKLNLFQKHTVDKYENPDIQLAFVPNPSDGFINIKSSHTLEAEIQLFNIEGKAMLVNAINGTEKMLDLSLLSDGPYILSIRNSDFESAQQIIIQK